LKYLLMSSGVRKMKSPPVIAVQLVHIEGPLKGEIQEFTDSLILIGRHPSSHVCFPKDQTAISRNHAEIVREGNRFKLVDKSTNGTFVNGKGIQEAYLKDGDVLVFAEGGPKVSFLTNVLDTPNLGTGPAQEDGVIPPTPPKEPPPVPPSPADPLPSGVPKSTPSAPVRPSPRSVAPSRVSEPTPRDSVPVQRAQVPLVIQFGPTLQSFKELPVTIGKNPSCEFTLEHPDILDQHTQIFFHQDQYWIKDLTGRNLLTINGQSLQLQEALHPDDEIALSPNGPRFRFLGGGRLAEIEVPQQEQVTPSGPKSDATPEKDPSENKGLKGAKAIFEKFLRR
jgi:pSer/pThr/pTyr-binding forkhead associated (FHA) protein